MKRGLQLAPLLAMIAIATPCLAAEGDNYTSVGATVYYDYFTNLTDGAEQGSDPTSGFELRRAYLTVKRGWGDMLLRYTADIAFNSATGNLNVFSKYAYLQHSGLVPGAKLLVGEHSPETHGFVEKRWQYRSVATTMSDEQKWTHSAQFGIGLQGAAMEKKVEYYLDVNNGNGYKAPVSKGGRGFAARLAARPSGGWWISAMASADAPGGTFADGTTTIALDAFNTYFEGLVGWEVDRAAAFFQIGQFEDAQWTGGGLNAAGGLDSRTSRGMSAFGRVMLRDRLSALARMDRVDPDTRVDGDRFDLALVGLDYKLHDGFFLQPNVQVTSFEAGGAPTEQRFVLTFFGEI
ncbi:MAG: hypothetical protein ACRDGR_07385 [bacterium]